MGKIRVAALGDVSEEKEAKRRAEARRKTRKSHPAKLRGKAKSKAWGLKAASA